MKDGYIKVAAVTPKVKVADCPYNTKLVIDEIADAREKKCSVDRFSRTCDQQLYMW